MERKENKSNPQQVGWFWRVDGICMRDTLEMCMCCMGRERRRVEEEHIYVY